MTRFSITDLKPGMRVADDIRDGNGRLLFKCGDVLSPAGLRILKIWGVTEAAVIGEEDGEGGMPPTVAARFDEAMERTRAHFRLHDPANPHVAALIRHCAMRLAATPAPWPPDPSDAPCPVRPDPAPRPVTLEAVLREDMRFGTLPSVFHRLVEVVNDPRSSAADAAEIISKDTDLSARLLRIANSAYYGLRARIETITRAVSIIGTNQLVSLAMGVSVVTAFRGVPQDLVDMRAFWTHSIACGVAARILAGLHRMSNSERFFVAGLLHDLGRLAIYGQLPDHGRLLLAEARSRGTTVRSLERDIVGFTHDEMGGAILRQWKCPVSLERNVQRHHRPESASGSSEPAIMAVSDLLANALCYGTSGEVLVPPLSDEGWTALGLPPGAVVQTANQMEYQVLEIIRFLETHE